MEQKQLIVILWMWALAWAWALAGILFLFVGKTPSSFRAGIGCLGFAIIILLNNLFWEVYKQNAH